MLGGTLSTGRLRTWVSRLQPRTPGAPTWAPTWAAAHQGLSRASVGWEAGGTWLLRDRWGQGIKPLTASPGAVSLGVVPWVSRASPPSSLYAGSMTVLITPSGLLPITQSCLCEKPSLPRMAEHVTGVPGQRPNLASFPPESRSDTSVDAHGLHPSACRLRPSPGRPSLGKEPLAAPLHSPGCGHSPRPIVQLRAAGFSVPPRGPETHWRLSPGPSAPPSSHPVHSDFPQPEGSWPQHSEDTQRLPCPRLLTPDTPGAQSRHLSGRPQRWPDPCAQPQCGNGTVPEAHGPPTAVFYRW